MYKMLINASNVTRVTNASEALRVTRDIRYSTST